ncbi:MAG: hypothetical protein PHU33_10240 [Bacteroidales bacterium]|nr:hypothetical protein [Bacteroidales bacterium]
MKPEENRPKEQIALIDKQMAERELQFNDLVKQAETQASSGDYASAIATLDQALEIKPGDQALTTRQNELRTLMTQTQEKEQAYANLMTQADQLFGENKLVEARLKYADASGLKPEENRPREQMALIDNKISRQKAIDDQVAFLIIKGDQQLADSLPENAIEYYSQALTLFPDYLIAKEKIEEAKQLSINLAKNKREFNDLILNADQLFKAGKLDEAESSYRQALSIQKTAAYPKSQIQLIEKERIRLGGIASNYKEAISQANASEAEGNLLSAVGSYKKALTYLPGDSLAVEAINRLNKSIQENEEQENRYKGYLAEAGFKVQSNDKKGAIELFRAAQLLFPDRDFPALKIKELEEQIQAESNLETNYAQLITHADELFAIGSLVESRKAYQESLGLKASASYPIQQIRTIDSTIQVKTDQQSLHSKLLKTADNYLTAGNLTMARETYEKTLDLPVDHTYSLQRITFIDSVENVRLSKQARYNELIVNADRYFQDNNLQEARSLYETASNIFPSEPHPQTRLIEIKNQLDAIQKNEQQFIDKMNQAADFFRNGHLVESRKTYESARAYNMEAELITNKIKHIDSLIDSQLKENQAYNQCIENGNAAFDAQRYEDARLFFAKAQEIKPQNSYPAEKIASINQIFADRQAAISTAYNQAIADADKLLAADEQEEAVKAYERALVIIPADEYATQQIEKAKDQILKKQLNKLAYNELIKSADSKLSTENYTEARSLYIQASDIYPFENYPRTQTEFIDIKLDELNRMEQQFQQLVLKGDSLFDSEQFQEAAMAYTQALVIKPDMYASERAVLSNQYFTEVSQKSKIYTDLIAFGDNYLKMKDYNNAIKQYDLAFNILPMRDEAVTKKERAEADMELEKLTFKNYQRSIQQADSLTINQQWVEAISVYQKACEFKPGDYYATSKISELKRTIAENNRRVVEYEKFIKQADSLYAIDELKKALPFYEKASRLFTEDNYPKSRISEIAAILSQPESMRGISYLDVIKKADSLFEARRYEKSTDLYLLAQSLKPAEEYPVIRLQETFEKLGMVTRVPILGQTTKLYVDETAKVVINKDIPQKDQQQYLVIRTQATDSVNTKLIINYGDKFSGNGGFVHTIPNNDGYSLYVGCLTDQSGWKGKPVEWMTFFAENGIITIQEIFIVTLP